MAKVTMHSLPANLTEEEVAELEAAEKMPIIFDDDCPEMTEEMLSQFHRTDMVTIQISPVNMKKVKSFGADYSKIVNLLKEYILSRTDVFPMH